MRKYHRKLFALYAVVVFLGVNFRATAQLPASPPDSVTISLLSCVNPTILQPNEEGALTHK